MSYRIFKGPKIFLCCLFSVYFIFGALLQAHTAPTPKAEIQSTVDAILNVLKDNDLRMPANKEKRRSLIRSLISDRFDFVEMARRSLARHWKERTPEEKNEFITVFSDLLVTSYIGKIEKYTDERITYDKETIRSGNKYGVVGTTVITKDLTIPIDYKVIRKDNKWWVYDVVIEGVSFISTYRSQYNKIIKRESYAQLIVKMKNKLKESREDLGNTISSQ